MPRYSSEPAPGNTTSGISPNREVSVDIKIGRIRLLVASNMASSTDILSSRICRLVCSIIKIALFTTTPVKITNPSMVSISRGWRINRFRIARQAIPPALATGMTNKIIAGRIKLRSKITISRKITAIAASTFVCIADQVRANSLAAPRTEICTFFSAANGAICGRISCSIF